MQYRINADGFYYLPGTGRNLALIYSFENINVATEQMRILLEEIGDSLFQLTGSKFFRGASAEENALKFNFSSAINRYLAVDERSEFVQSFNHIVCFSALYWNLQWLDTDFANELPALDREDELELIREYFYRSHEAGYTSNLVTNITKHQLTYFARPELEEIYRKQTCEE